MDNSKYTKYLKKVKARAGHICSVCEQGISPREFYYRETDEDKFLQTLNPEKFCSNCYKKYGNSLLHTRTRKHARVREVKKGGSLDKYLH